MIKAPKGSIYEPVPAGNHVARLYQIIHIGTIPSTWQGEERQRDVVRLTFELSNERKVFKEGEEAKPFSISREFTLSMGPKSHLRAFVEGFGGIKLTDEEAYNFDLDNMLGQECLLNVVHQESGGKVYSNIQNATPLPKGIAAPALFNPKAAIDINTSPWEVIQALPEFIQEKIYKSEEYAGRIAFEEQTGIETGASEPSIDISQQAEVDPKQFRPKVVGKRKTTGREEPVIN